MAHPSEQTLLIFAKAPELGAVKTRLAAAIGHQAARAIYERLSRRIIVELSGSAKWQTIVAATPTHLLHHRMLTTHGSTIMDQGRGDLGQRMANALMTEGPAIVVGTDIPELNVSRVGDAFRMLATKDVVFGPAEDGGFWLVGLRQKNLAQTMFRDVRWSTEHARADTLRNIDGARIGLLPVLRDLDDLDDLVSLDVR